jgi:hypothetical protein
MADPLDLLDSLNDMVEESPDSTTKSEHPELELLDKTQKLLSELTSVSEVYKIVDSRKQTLADSLKEQAFEQLVDKWFASKSRPKNSLLVFRKDGKNDCEGTFQIKSQFKINIPEDGTVYSTLLAVGFKSATAKKIVKENIDEVTITSMRPLNELTNGHYIDGNQFVKATDVEKSAGAKILSYAVAKTIEGNTDVKPLTPEERKVSILKKSKVVIKDGFMERAVNYCKTIDDLKNLLDVITPVLAVSHMKFALSGSEIDKVERLKGAISKLLDKS